MKLTRIINEGEKVPFGYGFVAVRWEYMCATEWMPIPLNYIKRLWYLYIAKLKLPEVDKEIIKAQSQVWDEGYRKGREEGYKQGYAKGEAKWQLSIQKMQMKHLEKLAKTFQKSH